MKKYLVVVVAMAVLGCCLFFAKGLGASQARPDGPVERYQLFQGTYNSLDRKNNVANQEIGIFLLDTATGKVSRYLTGLDKSGNYVESWTPTN